MSITIFLKELIAGLFNLFRRKEIKKTPGTSFVPLRERLNDLKQRNFSCRIRDGTLYGQLKIKNFTEAYLFFLNIAGQCDQIIRKPDNRICYIRQYDSEHQLILTDTIPHKEKAEGRIEGIDIKIRIIYEIASKVTG